MSGTSIVYDAPYLMSGTDIRCGDISLRTRYMQCPLLTQSHSKAFYQSICLLKSSTERAIAAYAMSGFLLPTRCVVLTGRITCCYLLALSSRMALLSAYAMSGSDLAYGGPSRAVTQT
eukprot:3181264-Rhodomonas_salina.3